MTGEGQLSWNEVEGILEEDWISYNPWPLDSLTRFEFEPIDQEKEPDDLLWACTVGSKVEKCWRLQPSERPVVERVARLRRRQNEIGRSLELMRQAIARKGPSDSTRDLMREAKQIRGRVNKLVKTWQYERSMEYLSRELYECCRVDKRRARVMARANGDSQVVLAFVMAEKGLSPAALAIHLDRNIVTILRWLSSPAAPSHELIPARILETLERRLEFLSQDYSFGSISDLTIGRVGNDSESGGMVGSLRRGQRSRALVSGARR